MSAELLRSALPEDAAEVARLAGVLGYEASVEQMRVRLDRLRVDTTQLVLVAPAGPVRLLGWIHAARTLVLESGAAVEILGLIVDPAARRRSLGRALVLAAEQWARDCGEERLLVRSNAVRTESHAFYPALGYTVAKTQHVYCKTLNTAIQGQKP
jgi:GNAT superfamily N-acetyltransferase